MPFDFDPFSALDLDHNLVVDTQDIQLYELQSGIYGLSDIDHDGIIDQFDFDLNNDNIIDKYQADLNHNGIIDKFEKTIGLTELNYDLNQDGNIDYIDEALAKTLQFK